MSIKKCAPKLIRFLKYFLKEFWQKYVRYSQSILYCSTRDTPGLLYNYFGCMNLHPGIEQSRAYS